MFRQTQLRDTQAKVTLYISSTFLADPTVIAVVGQFMERGVSCHFSSYSLNTTCPHSSPERHLLFDHTLFFGHPTELVFSCFLSHILLYEYILLKNRLIACFFFFLNGLSSVLQEYSLSLNLSFFLSLSLPLSPSLLESLVGC